MIKNPLIFWILYRLSALCQRVCLYLQSISIEPNLEALTRLLAILSDHVDLLLEDWYPSLGELLL